MVTLVPLSLGFGLEDALEQNGIFRDESSFLDLENLDQHSLLGELVFPGCQLLGNDLAIAGAPQLFDDRPMVGVDGIAADPRLTCECRDGQPVGSLLQLRVCWQSLDQSLQSVPEPAICVPQTLFGRCECRHFAGLTCYGDHPFHDRVRQGCDRIRQPVSWRAAG